MTEEEDSKKSIESLIRDNMSLFETYVLYAVIHDFSFWKTCVSGSVNTVKDQALINKRLAAIQGFVPRFSDFSKPVDNIIYNIISDIYRAHSEVSDNNPVLDHSIILSFFSNKLQKDRAFTSNDLQQIKLRLPEIEKVCDSVETYNTAVKSLIEGGVEIWLRFRRVSQITSSYLNKFATPEKLAQDLRLATEGITQSGAEEISFIDAMNAEEEEDNDRMPIANLPLTTKALKGGLKKRETYLIVAPPAGGKTVISCQIASGLAISGHKVMYITTEQPASELVPRMLSCNTNILFEKIVDGVHKAIKENRLTKDEIQQLNEFSELINGRLFFENWCSTGSKISTHLDSLIEHYKKSKDIDVVIIDWLGGGIVIPPSRGDLLRHFYKSASTEIKDMSLKHNVAIIVSAQAGDRKCDGVTRVTSSEISECTDLHQSYTAAMGISCLKESKTAMISDVANAVRKKQFFNWFKTRKGPSISYPVMREFEFQRFNERPRVETQTISANDDDKQNRRIKS